MPKRKRFTPKLKQLDENSQLISSSDDESDDANSLDLNYGNQLSSDDEKEEVLPIVDSEEDDEGMDYDESEASHEENDKDAVNVDAWGKKKSMYYSADFVDEDRGRSYREEDKEAAKAEETDALEIQRRFLDKIHSSVFESKLFSVDEPINEENKIAPTVTDWDSISKKKKIQILMKQNPEFVPILQEFKDRVVELKQVLSKYIKLTESSKESMEPMKLKLQLLLQYCMNCSMYLVLKTRRESLKSHPILEQINKFKSMLHRFKEMELTLSKPKPKLKKQKTVRFAPAVSEKMAKPAPISDRTEQETMEEDPMQEKRSVTYQIAKNKGLTPQRKKEYRNPRVKHRMKYKKALVKRKGQVRTPRTEMVRYGGELTGIQPYVTKSIKFK